MKKMLVNIRKTYFIVQVSAIRIKSLFNRNIELYSLELASVTDDGRPSIVE